MVLAGGPLAMAVTISISQRAGGRLDPLDGFLWCAFAGAARVLRPRLVFHWNRRATSATAPGATPDRPCRLHVGVSAVHERDDPDAAEETASLGPAAAPARLAAHRVDAVAVPDPHLQAWSTGR